jgi:peroxiredoxin
MRLRSAVIVSIVVAMAIAILSIVYAAATVGQKAPGFKLQSTSGQYMTLDQLRQDPLRKGATRPIMLVFWATWCPHCRAETGTLQTLQNKYKAQGFEVVSVALDAGGVKDVAPFMKEHNLTYTALVDPDNKVAGPLYGVRGVPQSFLLDKNGVIRKTYYGEYSGMDKAMDQDVQAVLK